MRYITKKVDFKEIKKLIDIFNEKGRLIINKNSILDYVIYIYGASKGEYNPEKKMFLLQFFSELNNVNNINATKLIPLNNSIIMECSIDNILNEIFGDIECAMYVGKGFIIIYKL